MRSTIQSATVLRSMVAVASAAAFSLLPAMAFGHGAGGDIALFTTDGRADVGFAILDDDDIVQEFFDPDVNVFSSILLPQSPNPLVPWQFGSPEPGFDANEGALPNSAEITVNLLELWYWDGGGEVSFTPPVGVQGGVAPQPMQSFPDGGFHSHPLFGVRAPSGEPAAGVYVGKLTLSVEGLTDSEPYYMVALVDDLVNSISDADERTAAAEAIGEMVREYLADPQGAPVPSYGGKDYTFYAKAVSAVPEPPGLALGWLALCGLLTLLRRRMIR